ncbi:hypothetical protein CPC08DRAFT_714565 [Agrocybe pediades]|nr:hypothetical protein CPC08DRAFT_714565 [Agrocybe pediades]
MWFWILIVWVGSARKVALRAAGLCPPVPHDTDAHRCNVFFYARLDCNDDAVLAGHLFEEKDRVGVWEIEIEFEPPSVVCSTLNDSGPHHRMSVA